MESGERLASPPSASSSVHGASSGLTPSSTLNTCGHLFRAASDQPFSLTTSSSAFPLSGFPAFGLYTTSSGHLEFSAHPQLGAFPEWWRGPDSHRRSAAFFHPLLGLPPLFAPAWSHDSSHLECRTPSRNGQGTPKGANGAVNGSSISTATRGSSSTTPLPAPGAFENTKVTNSSNRSHKSDQGGSQMQDTPIHAKIKKQHKKTAETSSNSDSESGSSSDTSSAGPSSSDSDDLEDDEDDEDDDDDKSIESGDSAKESGLKKAAKALVPGNDATADRKSCPPRGFPADSSGTSPAHLSPRPSPQLPVLPQSRPQALQAPRTRAEGPKQHQSVIKVTPSKEISPDPLSLSPSSKPPALSPNRARMSGGSLANDPLSLISGFRLKQELFKQAFPAHLMKQKTQKKSSSSTLPPPKLFPETLGPHQPPPPHDRPSNLFLSSALLQDAVQEAPLALIAGPRCRGPSSSSPLNLSTTSPVPPRPLAGNKAASGDLFRGGESDIPGSKDSGDSVEEEDEEEEDEEEDSDDSLSESDSIFGSDSGCSDDDGKERGGAGTNAQREKTALALPKLTSTDSSASCSPLNLQVIKTSTPGTSCGASASYGRPSSSSPCSKTPGSDKKKHATEERVPLEFGWQRGVRMGNLNGCLLEDVALYAACGKKLRQYQDLMKGMPWSLLGKQEVVPHLPVTDGQRGAGSSPSLEHRRTGSGSRARRRKGRSFEEAEALIDAKLLRKLEAQEIARQATQIKLMRKLEKQALAQAAKEAKKRQAMMAAEEKRKQKEQIKILKQQEKMKRIQQIRMEKALRSQQILEAKRKKKEEAANAKTLEAEKRTKDKEMRRRQAVILKHQELERHRLDMERERRRQHIMLMKAVEARKKAEEKERLKQEKRDEKRLNKERKLELRRLELEMAKELKKPNEDMCLADHKPLPELSRIPGLVLPGSTFSQCLMVLQFLRSFGKVLGLDVNADVPSLGVLQEGLLNVGDSVGEVQDLLVRMLSAVVCDPGLPPGHRTKTALGEPLTSVGMNRDNVSELLQIYMEAHCGRTELAALAQSLRTKAFQAHTPAQKASVLAFLVNELACSKSVVGEIDRNIDHMASLRRDKWVVEGKLRKLRIIHAKKTGKRESSAGGGEDTQALCTPPAGRKRKRRGGGSDEDEDEDEDSDDQGEEDEEEEEGGKKGKKVETCEDEDEGDQAASVEELEKQIEKLIKQEIQIRRKVFEASHCLRSMTFGQDRYRRRYWVLPKCGGVFVEGTGRAEGPEETEREEGRLKSAVPGQVKEEPLEHQGEKPPDLKFEGSMLAPGLEEEKDSSNLFLQKPDPFSKLGCLLEASPQSVGLLQNQADSLMAPSSPTSPSPRTTLPSSPLPAAVHPCVPTLCPQPNDQLFRAQTEKNGHWFNLLPRSPCDDTSITTGPTHPPSCVGLKSPASLSPVPPTISAGPQTPAGVSNCTSALQAKPGFSLMGPLFFGWASPLVSPNQHSSSSPMPGTGGSLQEGNGSPFLAPTSTSTPTSISESPAPPGEKPLCALSPALEVPKPQDYPRPLPIPEEMLKGWWRVTDIGELQALVKALHCRGIREKALQKQLQRHMEYIGQSCAKNRGVTLIDETEQEDSQATEEAVESWCVEEQAMEMDIAALQQVEELERKVTSASLQVKGWIYPEPQSEREDLVYHEHRLLSGPHQTGSGDGGLERRVNNPLDIAVTRLAELEKNIERRYLKSPLGTTIQIKLDNVGTVTAPAPAPSSSDDGEGGEEEVAPGMKVWRKALSEVRSAAQLALCVQQLQKSIAWERSIMKVYCQICRKGDNEDLLLLCDGCDKGCHTYCHRPKITTIPDGDWFCPACISKASGQSPKSKKQLNRGVGAGSKPVEVKRNRKPSVAGEISEEDGASANSTPKKGLKEPKKRKAEESSSTNPAKRESPTCLKKSKPATDNTKDLAMCSTLLSELENHPDAWPFHTPVNPKSVPGYRKVIKKPMDLSTIREKLSTSQYQDLETFVIDVNLVFDNCEKFNEDNSEIGRAGHSMRKFFERRWTELLTWS